MLTVTTRQALEAAAGALQDGLPYRGGVPPLAPTWRALRAYFEFVFEAENLTLSDTALAILQATSFAQLTGCPAQCAYTDPLFPSANHTTPITVDDPAANASCTAPYPGTQQTLSSGFATSSSLCDADWNEAMVSWPALASVPCCAVLPLGRLAVPGWAGLWYAQSLPCTLPAACTWCTRLTPPWPAAAPSPATPAVGGLRPLPRA